MQLYRIVGTVAIIVEFISLMHITWAALKWGASPPPPIPRRTRIMAMTIQFGLSAIVGVFYITSLALTLKVDLADEAIAASFYVSGAAVVFCILQSIVCIYMNTSFYQKHLQAVATPCTKAGDVEEGRLMPGSDSDHNDLSSDTDDVHTNDHDHESASVITAVCTAGSDDDAEV